jgi:hypothetical protein
MAQGNKVSLASRIVAQGELAVGSGTVPFSATLSVPCSRVWVGAPSAKHTKGSANTTPILIGKNTTSTNASGGQFLDTTNNVGFFIPIDDLLNLGATGFTAGDVVEYIAYG